jgi:hypothetical protein
VEQLADFVGHTSSYTRPRWLGKAGLVNMMITTNIEHVFDDLPRFATLRRPWPPEASGTHAIRQAGGLRYVVAQASSPAVPQASRLPQRRASGFVVLRRK